MHPAGKVASSNQVSCFCTPRAQNKPHLHLSPSTSLLGDSEVGPPPLATSGGRSSENSDTFQGDCLGHRCHPVAAGLPLSPLPCLAFPRVNQVTQQSTAQRNRRAKAHSKQGLGSRFPTAELSLHAGGSLTQGPPSAHCYAMKQARAPIPSRRAIKKTPSRAATPARWSCTRAHQELASFPAEARQPHTGEQSGTGP